MSGVSNTRPLRDLLRAAVIEHDLSTDKIADNAGGLRGRSWLAAKQTEEHREGLLSEIDLEALSRGYRVSQRRLRVADLDGFGLMERGDQPRAWLLEEEVAELTDQQRQAVRFVIAAMREGRGEGGIATVTPLRPDHGPQSDVAARTGTPALDRERGEQDEAAEGPQDPGPDE